MDLMEQIRLESESYVQELSRKPAATEGIRIASAFIHGAQALLNLLGRSATSEGHPPRVRIYVSDARIISVDAVGYVPVGGFEYLSKIEHEALRAADLLEIERLKGQVDRLAAMWADGESLAKELSQEREARKADAAELERLKGELEVAKSGRKIIEGVASFRDRRSEEWEKLCTAEREKSAKLAEELASQESQLKTWEGRCDKLTAALEKVAGYSPNKGLVKAMPMRAIQEMHAAALEALREEKKPEEPHPRGYCEKCGLPLEAKASFPLLCKCEQGAG